MKKVTDIQIKAWKKEYGEVYQIEVFLDDDTAVSCYVKKPTLKTLSYASGFSDDRIKAGTAVLNDCWIAGDQRIKDSEEAWISVMEKTNNLFKVKSSTVKKL